MSCGMPSSAVDMDSCASLRKFWMTITCFFLFLCSVKVDSDPQILALLSRTYC